MKIIANIGKGGGGKSTIAANLATVAAGRGLSVCLLDADPQSSLCQWRAVRQTGDIKVVRCEGTVRARVKEAANAGIDWLIIDTAPELGEHTLEAVRIADFVLIPGRPANFDLAVTKQRVELLLTTGRAFTIVVNDAPPRRRRREAPLVRETREALLNIGGRLWDGQITHRVAIIYALLNGQSVLEFAPDSPAVDEYIGLWDHIVRKVGEAHHDQAA
ncbi:AAA family ATPase [Xanthobacteraceae bacterium Astr-EGSB]|uniref:AAA family ATPase n=1 Tax=Astrobacterium formosum TaxID=3069710 RepID=UPI0027B1B53D|nr:AAA family ATPase [Xanthobacteraceae bacterium Astr-EGSB]